MVNKYKYNEPLSSLDGRISAHANFSNFNLHDWILSKFNIKKGDNILDLGCGNGNYTSLFFKKVSESGVVYGIDKSAELISEANERHGKLSQNVNFSVADYDSFDKIKTPFDWIFSIYSLYYTSDSKALASKLKKSISHDGKFIVIGPASNNALELDKFNFEVTGVLPNKEHRLRNERIEMEFFPLFKSLFGNDNVEIELIDSALLFPTISDYAEYYWSTLLWRESTNGLDNREIKKLKIKTINLLNERDKLEIIKQMTCLIGCND